MSYGLDWIVETATWLLESSGLIEALPVPEDVFIPRRARFDHWGKKPVNLPFPSRACTRLNRPALSPPTSLHHSQLPSSTTASKASSEDSGSLNSVRVNEKATVDTSSSPWKPAKADYWSAVWSAQVSAPAPKTGSRGNLGLEVEATVRPSKPSRAIPRAGVDRLDNSAIERPDTPAQDAGEGSAPHDSGAPIGRLDTPAQDAGERSTPHDSGVTLPTQVSGKARKKGLLGKLRVKVAATVASAKRSRAIVKAKVDRIKIATKLGKRKTVVKFFPLVEVQEADRSIWDEEARWKYVSKARERRIEASYWLWAEGPEAEGIPRSVFDTPNGEEDEDDENDRDEENEENEE
ncbi:hypothetical protein FRC05_010850 [Tulasnella sp. 425]|nr:hypothetical protein FRC05_010850 [Tulasnella sp. 425]